MAKSSVTRRLLNLFLTLWGIAIVALTLVLVFAYDGFIRFFEDRLAADGKFSNPRAVVYTIYLFLVSVGVTLALLKGALVYARHKIAFSSLPVHIKAYYLVTLLTIFICIKFKPVEVLYGEDGILENITVLLLIGSAFIFLYLATRYKYTFRGFTFFSLFTIFLLFAMEEISWGQRIIGWETTPYMLEKNVQQENNFHNLFNDYFPIMYLIVTGSISAVFFYRNQLVNFFKNKRPLDELVELMPSVNFFYAGYFYLFLLIYTLTLDRGGETFEIIFALTLFFYSFDLLEKYKSNKKKPASNSSKEVKARRVGVNSEDE